MPSERTCAKCAAALDAGAPGGHCPACLLTLALSLSLPEPEPDVIGAAESVGDRIGRYRLLEQIGEGGCGVVYRAGQEEPVRREVALKVIKLGMDTRSVIARFEAERQALALMDHMNIARVLDAGATATGRPYFVMELVRGPRITEYCDAHGLSTRERLELFIQVGEAVQHAHQKGVIHRDLKPSNVLVALNDGRPVPKIIDFGIAKATGDQPLTDRTVFTALGQFLGTPAYMSPEQAGSEGDVDTRSDLYSLGVLLYELLTGQLPFPTEELRRAAAGQVARIIRERQPVRPSARLTTLAADELTLVAQRRQTAPAALSREVAGDLDWIVMKALEKDRERRYGSANGFIEDLRRHLRDEPVTARPPSRLQQARRLVRQHRVLFTAATAVVTSLVLGLALALGSLRREKAATAEARMISSASDFLQAQNFAKEDHFGRALTALARSIRADPSNHVAVTRMASLMTSHTWMIPSLTLHHDGDVKIVQFSPDGRYLVTVSNPRDSTELSSHGQFLEYSVVRLWDAHTGRMLSELPRGPGIVNSINFSPNSKRLAAAYDLSRTNAIASVWQLSDGQKIAERRWLMPKMTDIIVPDRQAGNSGIDMVNQFSPDGRLLLTVRFGKGYLWEADSGRILTVLDSPKKLRLAQFSPDGTGILTCSFNEIRRWDIKSGKSTPVPSLVRVADEDAKARNSDAWIASAQFSTDGGRIIATYGDDVAQACDNQTLGLQPLSLGLEKFRLPEAPIGMVRGPGYASGAAVVHTGNIIRIWDRWSRILLAEPARNLLHWEQGLMDINGQFVVAPTNRGAVVLDTQNQRRVARLESDSPISSAVFNADGTRIATVNSDHDVLIWDRLAEAASVRVIAPKITPDFPSLEDEAHDQAFGQLSPDGLHFLTFHSDRTVRTWDAKSGDPTLKPLVHEGRVYSARYSLDGKKLLTVSEGLTATVWDAATGAVRFQPIRQQMALKTAYFNGDGSRLVAWSGNTLKIIHVFEGGKTLTLSVPNEAAILRAVFSPEGDRLTTLYVKCQSPATDLLSDGQYAWQSWNAGTGQPLTVPEWNPISKVLPAVDESRVEAGDDAGISQRPSTSAVGTLVSLLKSPERAAVLARLVNRRTGFDGYPWNELRGDSSLLPVVKLFRVSARLPNRLDPEFSRAICDAGNIPPDLYTVIDVKTGQNLDDGCSNPRSFEPEDRQHSYSWPESAVKLEEERFWATFVLSAPGGNAYFGYRIWYIAPADTNPPDWLPDLADAVSGVSTVDSSSRALGNAERLATMERIRQRLNRETGTNAWLRWGRWFLADPATRPPTPYEMGLPAAGKR